MSQYTRMLRRAAAGLLLSAGATGCVDFTGPGIDTNPNVPTVATPGLLFPAVQAFQQALITGDPMRYTSLYTQHMMGVARQWQSYASYGQFDENLLFWDNFYTGGGLVDLRSIQSGSAAAGDKVFQGIGQAYEAMVMDVVADLWGDIPYSEAVNPAIAVPKLDQQPAVYTALQTLLTNALANVTSGAGPGPGPKDLVYQGNVAKWTKWIHSMKARIAMHQRDYVTAAAEAAQGMSVKADDYLAYHSSTTGEESSNFQFIRNRGDDILASDTLVQIMLGRADPRLPLYFARNAAGNYKGAVAGTAGTPDSISGLSAARAAATWRPTMLGSDETLLILAEAEWRKTAGAGSAAMTAAINAYKANNGLTIAMATTGVQALQDILTEKYIAMFQNLESYSDYRRTCWPNIRASSAATTAQPKIPTRFYYPLSERQTNTNIPSAAIQQANARNAVDKAGFVSGQTAPPTPPGGGTCQGMS